MSDLRDEPLPEAQTDRHVERERRRLVMYISVGGVMTFIVALWVMVLPIQLDRARENGAKSVFSAGATGISDTKASVLDEWQASMESTKRSVMNLSDGLEEEMAAEAAAAQSAGEGGTAAVDVERLKERLEAAPTDAEALLPAEPTNETTPDATADNGQKLNE